MYNICCCVRNKDKNDAEREKKKSTKLITVFDSVLTANSNFVTLICFLFSEGFHGLVLEQVLNWFQPGASSETVCFSIEQDKSRSV